MIKDRFNNTIDVVYPTGRTETWAVNKNFEGLFVEDTSRSAGYRELRGGWDCVSPTPQALLKNIKQVAMISCKLVKDSVRGFQREKVIEKVKDTRHEQNPTQTMGI